jgi:hypothetical protein
MEELCALATRGVVITNPINAMAIAQALTAEVNSIGCVPLTQKTSLCRRDDVN